MTTSPSVRRPPRRDARPLLALAGLAVIIAVLHGRCLSYGLFLDDHAHYRQLREADWSLGGLVAACRLELFGGVLEAWWMPEVTLRFFRPTAFALMKLTYTLAHWSPLGGHLASLCWHFAACALLLFLLRRLGASWWIAWAAAALFAIHPGHLVTVQWIAVQSELMVTTFLLAATLCYGRFRGWRGTGGVVGGPTSGRSGSLVSPHWPWAIACWVFFTLALGCRENAVMFPLVLLALESLLARRRRSSYLLFAALVLIVPAYLAVRAHYLHGMALPPRPYVMPPDDPGFLRFVFDKAGYYLLGELFLVPCIPIGGLPYLTGHPFWFYGGTVVGFALLALLLFRRERRATTIFGIVWMFLFMAPVLPAFASPHHLYLPGIGWAVIAVRVIEALRGTAPTALGHLARYRATLAAAGTATVGVGFAACTHFFALPMEAAQAVEDMLVKEVIATPTGLHDGDTLYFANLPLVAHYVKLAVEERTGLRGLRAVALTWSPRLLGTVTPSEVAWLDSDGIEIRTEGDRYFSGPLGVLAAEASGRPEPIRLGEMIAARGYRVELAGRDERGITALRFRFDRRPPAPGLHLYWGSGARWAYEIRPTAE